MSASNNSRYASFASEDEDVCVVVSGAIYRIAPPNATEAKFGVSLQNKETGFFLRHKFGILSETPVQKTDEPLLLYDSTFIPYFHGDAVMLECSNPNLANQYVLQHSPSEAILSGYSPEKNDLFAFRALRHSPAFRPEPEGLTSVQARDLAQRLSNAYSAALLRDAAKKIRKKRQIVFIGTGSLGENGIYVCQALCERIRVDNKGDVSVFYLARNRAELDSLNDMGAPCRLWDGSPSLILDVLQSGVAVYSGHLLADDGNAVLSAACSGAIKVQLWHGFAAKKVGCARELLDNGTDAELRIPMIEDCCGIDVVTLPFESSSVAEAYREAFPGARQAVTGNARTDATIRRHAPPSEVGEWLGKVGTRKKILFVPTFRKTRDETIRLVNSFLGMVEAFENAGAACAVKLHPLSADMAVPVAPGGWLHLSKFVDAYAILDQFDAMASDYSSIRYEFAMLNRPVILFRPDHEQYLRQRQINAAVELEELESTFYEYRLDETNCAAFLESVFTDPLRMARKRILEKLNLRIDGFASRRSVDLLLSLLDEIPVREET